MISLFLFCRNFISVGWSCVLFLLLAPSSTSLASATNMFLSAPSFLQRLSVCKTPSARSTNVSPRRGSIYFVQRNSTVSPDTPAGLSSHLSELTDTEISSGGHGLERTSPTPSSDLSSRPDSRTCLYNGDIDDQGGVVHSLVMQLFPDSSIALVKSPEKGSFSSGIWHLAVNETSRFVVKSLESTVKKINPLILSQSSSFRRKVVHADLAEGSDLRAATFNNYEALVNSAAFQKWQTQGSSSLKIIVPTHLNKIESFDGPSDEADETDLYIEILPLAQGRSLASILEDSSKDPEALGEMLAHIAREIARFHWTSGLAHGDLNVGNVFIDGQLISLIDTHSLGISLQFQKPEEQIEIFMEDLLSLRNSIVAATKAQDLDLALYLTSQVTISYRQYLLSTIENSSNELSQADRKKQVLTMLEALREREF